MHLILILVFQLCVLLFSCLIVRCFGFLEKQYINKINEACTGLLAPVMGQHMLEQVRSMGNSGGAGAGWGECVPAQGSYRHLLPPFLDLKSRHEGES